MVATKFSILPVFFFFFKYLAIDQWRRVAQLVKKEAPDFSVEQVSETVI
jgi:hypothetical protein